MDTVVKGNCAGNRMFHLKIKSFLVYIYVELLGEFCFGREKLSEYIVTEATYVQEMSTDTPFQSLYKVILSLISFAAVSFQSGLHRDNGGRS